MENEKEIKMLWRIRKTIMQLCNDRMYIVTHAELNQTLDEFKARFGSKLCREQLTILLEHIFEPNDKIFVFFPEDVNVKMPTVKAYYKRMQQENVSHAIIIVRSSITKSAKQALVDNVPRYYMEYFLEDQLLVNITHHELVPKHTALTAEERQELLQRLRAEDTQLPRILLDDPVARYYGFKRGQVVKIDRPSETAGRYIYYRLVI